MSAEPAIRRLSVFERVRYRSEAAIFFALIGFFRLFRLDAASAIGGWLGSKFLYRTHLSRRARANLVAAYPQMASHERERIIREMWDNLGRNIAEYAHLRKLSIRGEKPRIELAGLEN